MQTLSSILAIASIMCAATATPAGPAAAAPSGLIKVFFAPECTEAAGAGVSSQSVILPKGECIKISPAFNSFQGVIKSACPKGATAQITAYSDQSCMDEGVSAGTLPTNGIVGACQEILIEAPPGGVDLGGQSAKFTCV